MGYRDTSRDIRMRELAQTFLATQGRHQHQRQPKHHCGGAFRRRCFSTTPQLSTVLLHTHLISGPPAHRPPYAANISLGLKIDLLLCVVCLYRANSREWMHPTSPSYNRSSSKATKAPSCVWTTRAAAAAAARRRIKRHLLQQQQQLRVRRWDVPRVGFARLVPCGTVHQVPRRG